jgi:alpha-glucosidase
MIEAQYVILTDSGGIVDELKPVQSLLMAHVAREAIYESRPGIRPYIINRSGYAGIQKYSSTWAGDNFTSWKTLKFNIATILGMGLSGVANNGCDIGGFWGPCPDAELLVRWIQNGIFQPRFSIHSCNTDNTVTQPWMYSDYADIIRDTIKFRYQLMPYFYSLLYEAHIKGTPIARPLFYEFQNDLNIYDESCNFMLGSSLLIANVVEEGVNTKSIYLPEGSDWYYWHNRQKFTGGQTVDVDVDITTIPLFIRDSAILPMTEDYTGINKDVIDNLNIIIGAGEDSSFTIFEDDKETYKYLDGECLKTDITVKSGRKVIIDFNKHGNFKSTVEKIILDVINKGKGPFWVTVDDKKIQSFLNRDEWEISDEGWYYSVSKESAMIKYPNINKSYQVIVSFEHFDLIGM